MDLLALNAAIGRQKKIAQKIIEKAPTTYGLNLKGIQGTLRDEVWVLFTEQMARRLKDVTISCTPGCDAEHGRIETREVFARDETA